MGSRGWRIIGGGVMSGLSVATLGLTSAFVGSFELALAIMFVIGICNITYTTSIQNSLQMLVPDNMRGRVMGFYGMTHNIMPLGWDAGGCPGQSHHRTLCHCRWWAGRRRLCRRTSHAEWRDPSSGCTSASDRNRHGPWHGQDSALLLRLRPTKRRSCVRQWRGQCLIIWTLHQPPQQVHILDRPACHHPVAHLHLHGKEAAIGHVCNHVFVPGSMNGHLHV